MARAVGFHRCAAPVAPRPFYQAAIAPAATDLIFSILIFRVRFSEPRDLHSASLFPLLPCGSCILSMQGMHWS